MAILTATARKVLAVTTFAAVAGLAAPGTASAKQFQLYPCWKFGTCNALKPKPHYGYGGPGWGYGAAAMGGLAVGMIAASAASASAPSSGECYYVRRKVEDEDGNLYIRRVRVCE
jgi:hypothetical protein